MRLFVLLILSLCCTLISTQVIVLTESNFDTVIDGSKPAIIEFFAPWCGHCKQLAPEYDIVGNSYSRVQDKVIIAQVDCTQDQQLCVRYDIEGYPTLKWFPGGEESIELYAGKRTAEAISEFINLKTGLEIIIGQFTGPTRVVELNDEIFDSIVLDQSKDVFLEFYATWCGYCKKLEPIYDQLATVYQNEEKIVIARIDGVKYTDKLKKYHVDGFPTLVYVNGKYRDIYHYETERTIEKFVEFINEKAGTFRKPNGHLNETAGLIPELDELAALFRSAENKDDASSAGIAAAKVIGTPVAKIYARVFSEARRNPEYPPSEVERLTKMINTRSVNSKKVDEFIVRINILSQFIDKVPEEVDIVDSDSCNESCAPAHLSSQEQSS